MNFLEILRKIEYIDYDMAIFISHAILARGRGIQPERGQARGLI